jgi:hypothetical protein
MSSFRSLAELGRNRVRLAPKVDQYPTSPDFSDVPRKRHRSPLFDHLVSEQHQGLSDPEPERLRSPEVDHDSNLVGC